MPRPTTVLCHLPEGFRNHQNYISLGHIDLILYTLISGIEFISKSLPPLKSERSELSAAGGVSASYILKLLFLPNNFNLFNIEADFKSEC